MLTLKLLAVVGLGVLLHLSESVWAFPSTPSLETRLRFDPTCVAISKAVSSASKVFYPGSLTYLKDISHWASSSSETAACSVEPGTAEDVGKILKIVGSSRKPFAVKGGGHTTNPGFSSTPGVQIAMCRFNDVKYDKASQLVVVGAGLIWDDVYAALEPYGRNVVGGRVTGVGVAGFTLGGGFSWKTNQHGLTIDTVVAFELVLPSGQVITVNESEPDLFFALKGGFNNFGIVTKFTFRTFPQTKVWGGVMMYTEPNRNAVSQATVKFSQQVTDPKASIITSYNFVLGQPTMSLLIFYDAPTPPSGIFDDFLVIPHLTKDVSTRSFSSLVRSAPSNATTNTRGFFHAVSLLEYTPTVIRAIQNESDYYGALLTPHSAALISYEVEPFLPTIFAHGEASAYPPTRSRGLLPFGLYFAWALPTEDGVFHDAIRASADRVRAVAVAEGQDIADAPLYGNYALYDTPLGSIYGNNLPRLRQIKALVDPSNIMGLAGGFKF